MALLYPHLSIPPLVDPAGRLEALVQKGTSVFTDDHLVTYRTGRPEE
jgi:hypothetical protein